MAKEIAVYCAGKIRANDWRHDLVAKEIMSELACSEHDYVGRCPDDDVLPDRWFAHPMTIDGEHDFVYSGPYFLECDHRCFHGKNEHGVAANKIEAHRAKVVSLCQQAIETSDWVFAWIDAPDAYGTIAEIGYAVAFNKPVFIAGPRRFDDMWFVYEMARSVHISDMYTESWIPTIIKELNLNLCNMPYADYLKTDHWKMARQVTIKRYGSQCALCSASHNLHVHHRTYERRGCEQSSDLITLCAKCHAKFHDKIPVEGNF